MFDEKLTCRNCKKGRLVTFFRIELRKHKKYDERTEPEEIEETKKVDTCKSINMATELKHKTDVNTRKKRKIVDVGSTVTKKGPKEN